MLQNLNRYEKYETMACANLPKETSKISNKQQNETTNVKSRYDIIKTLGKGTYGKVKLAVDRITQRKVAIKMILKDKVKERNDLKHILREMEILQTLSHPHIIEVYEVYENQDRIVIVMEYAPGGELFDYLADRKSISEDEARVFFAQIVSAVHHCHKKGVVHRDLKLENILLGENYQIKIADFGLANKYDNKHLLNTFCGSPLYASPEIINGIPYVGPEVDSWSLGVLLYSLVFCMMPFDGRDYNMLSRQISKGEFTKPSKHSDSIDLIKQLLTVDPKKRLSVSNIMKHEWMQVPEPDTIYCYTTDNNGNIVNKKYDTSAGGDDSFDCYITKEAWTNDISWKNNKKSILKRKDSSELPSDSDSYILSPASSRHQHVDDVFNCGLQAKDSLKLKAKPRHGSTHRRRMSRSKRDRESGYYSSPERNHDSSTAPPAGQVPVIKAKLVPQSVKCKAIKCASAPRQSAHDSSNFDQMLGNFTNSLEHSNKYKEQHSQNNEPPNQLHSVRPHTLPVTIPRSMKRSRSSETPECLTPTSAHLVAELQRILPPREGGKHRSEDNSIYSSYEYLASNSSSDGKDAFSSELDAMMQQLNLELEQAYETAVRI